LLDLEFVNIISSGVKTICKSDFLTLEESLGRLIAKKSQSLPGVGGMVIRSSSQLNKFKGKNIKVTSEDPYGKRYTEYWLWVC
jgi:hypothetical protein